MSRELKDYAVKRGKKSNVRLKEEKMTAMQRKKRRWRRSLLSSITM